MMLDKLSFDSQLAAAAGDDRALIGQLRAEFLAGVSRQIDLLDRSRCDGNWAVAAMRLKGLALSFHASALAQLAEEALSGAPRDPAVLARLKGWAEDFAKAGWRQSDRPPGDRS